MGARADQRERRPLSDINDIRGSPYDAPPFARCHAGVPPAAGRTRGRPDRPREAAAGEGLRHPRQAQDRAQGEGVEQRRQHRRRPAGERRDPVGQRLRRHDQQRHLHPAEQPSGAATRRRATSTRTARARTARSSCSRSRSRAAASSRSRPSSTASSAPISVQPPNDGTGACALLALGGGDSYSVRFADGTIKNNGAKQFKVLNPTTEGTCVPCGNGFLDAGEQCDPNGLSCGAAACGSDCTCPCDFLDTSECMFPFPSDFLTEGGRNHRHRPARPLPERRHAAQRLERPRRVERLQPERRLQPRRQHPPARAERRPRHDRRGPDHRHRALALCRRTGGRGECVDAPAPPDLGGARFERDRRGVARADHPSGGQFRRGNALHRRAAQHEGLLRHPHLAPGRLPRLPRRDAHRRSGEGGAPRAHGGALHHARRRRHPARRSLPGLGLHGRQRAQPHRAAALHARRRLRAPRRHCSGLHGHLGGGRSRRRDLPPRHRHVRGRALRRQHHGAGALPTGTGRPAYPPGDAAARLLHLPHPARRAGDRRRHRRPGAGVDLRPRPARIERPRSTPATSRTWPTSTTSSSAPPSGSAWRTRTSSTPSSPCRTSRNSPP